MKMNSCHGPSLFLFITHRLFLYRHFIKRNDFKLSKREVFLCKNYINCYKIICCNALLKCILKLYVYIYLHLDFYFTQKHKFVDVINFKRVSF